MSVSKLSIVIIGRNEAVGIAKCVRAAIDAADQIGGAEIVYVDSYSTDDTVEIVEALGVKAITLDPSLRLAPSSGRFWGSKNVSGEYILFLDADTHIYRDFLLPALTLLDSDASLAGVNGYTDDLNEAGEKLFDIEERSEESVDVKWLRGPCCLYRRQALMEVGSFNPKLVNEEEAELGLRLLKAGWKLRVIPVFMALHTRCYHPQSIESVISTFRRDIRSKRIGEITRTVAYSFKAGNGLAFCWLRLKTTILFLAWLLLICGLYFLPEPLYPELAVVAVGAIGILAIYWKKRSLSGTLLFIPAKILNIVDIAAGVFSAFFRLVNHKFGRGA